MLEIMLLSSCMWMTGTNGCSKMGEAYFIQSGDQQIVYDYSERLRRDHERAAWLLGVGYTAAVSHQVTGKLTEFVGFDVIGTLGSDKSLIIFRKSLP